MDYYKLIEKKTVLANNTKGKSTANSLMCAMQGSYSSCEAEINSKAVMQ
jgi:hypothetical protein